MKSSANRYYKNSKISEAKFRQLIRCFSMDLTATDTATLTGLSTRIVNDIYLKIRRRIAEECQRQAPYMGELEVDKSYFGSKRVAANGDEEPAAKPSSSGSSSVRDRSLQRSFRMPGKSRCRR